MLDRKTFEILIITKLLLIITDFQVVIKMFYFCIYGKLVFEYRWLKEIRLQIIVEVLLPVNKS